MPVAGGGEGGVSSPHSLDTVSAHPGPSGIEKKDVRVATFTVTVLQSQRDIVTAVENLTQEVHKIKRRI